MGLGVSEYLSVPVAGSGADLFRPGIQVVAGTQEFPSVREFKDLWGGGGGAASCFDSAGHCPVKEISGCGVELILGAGVQPHV